MSEKKKVNKKYIPDSLSAKDKKKQAKSIKEGKDRPKVDYKSKRSSWVTKFEDKYNHKITAKAWIDKNLMKKEGQEQSIKKGVAAYYTAGSRPNVTATQWGLARLASVILGGPARKVDLKIWEKYKVKK